MDKRRYVESLISNIVSELLKSPIVIEAIKKEEITISEIITEFEKQIKRG